MRPLYFDFSGSDAFVVNGTGSNDPRIVHQFMFGEYPSLGNRICSSVRYTGPASCTGPRLLIAPVGVLNTTSKEVYLPRLPESFIAQNFSWTHWSVHLFAFLFGRHA